MNTIRPSWPDAVPRAPWRAVAITTVDGSMCDGAIDRLTVEVLRHLANQSDGILVIPSLCSPLAVSTVVVVVGGNEADMVPYRGGVQVGMKTPK